METLQVSQQLSLQILTGLMRDAESIQQISLKGSIQWLQKQNFPEILSHLCKLGKQVETSLITGECLKLDRDTFVNSNGVPMHDVFPLKEGSYLPTFCYPLFVQLFTLAGTPRYILRETHSKTGSVYTLLSYYDGKLDSDWHVARQSASTVLLLRQILLAFSKASDLPVEAKEDDEIAAFVKRATREGPYFRNQSGSLKLSVVFSWARALVRELLTQDGSMHVELAQWESQPFGSHGPGAVSGREKGREKWDFVRTKRTDLTGLFQDASCAEIGKAVEDNSLNVSRLCVVPKDFRAHRLICAEPKELQFAQQGLLRVFEHIVKKSQVINSHVNLRDQSPSFYASRDLRLGTIDLKDASDMLSLRLLKLLFPKEVYQLITRFRSDGVCLTDGSIMKPYSTAFTMGNALCFPIETIVFWSLSCATILSLGGFRSCTPDTNLTVLARKLRMRVFGDDIIVPIEWVDSVAEVLTCAGLLVNYQKTCKLSLVRESCGSWWYAGFDCRITKFKHTQLTSLDQWMSFQDVIPFLRENGLFKTADILDANCAKIYPTRDQLKAYWRGLSNPLFKPLPEPSSFDLSAYIRYNPHLMRLEIRIPIRELASTRALPGRLGYLTWYTQSAKRFFSTCHQVTKLKWVALY